MAKAVHPDLSVDNQAFGFNSGLIDRDALLKERPDFRHLFSGEYDDYVYPKIASLKRTRFLEFQKAADELFQLFKNGLDQIIKEDSLSLLGIPKEAHALIKHCHAHKHPHFFGRFDFAGGLYSEEIKLIEFNADTPTLLMETGDLQLHFQDSVMGKSDMDVLAHLTNSLKDIIDHRELENILLTSLGHQEDRSNALALLDRLQSKQIQASYLNLTEVIFSDDEGVFGQYGIEDYLQFDTLIKWVPWEFMLFEEPELFSLLEELIIKDLVFVLNPITSWVYQNKRFMAYLYANNPDHPNLLPCYDSAEPLKEGKYVEKPAFGRLGENIAIMDQEQTVTKTDGHCGQFEKVYQKFHPLDKYFDVYLQPSIYYSNGASAFNLRAQEDMIIDDDCYFVCTKLI